MPHNAFNYDMRQEVNYVLIHLHSPLACIRDILQAVQMPSCSLSTACETEQRSRQEEFSLQGLIDYQILL